jgi:hypothetical protein
VGEEEQSGRTLVFSLPDSRDKQHCKTKSKNGGNNMSRDANNMFWDAN